MSRMQHLCRMDTVGRAGYEYPEYSIHDYLNPGYDIERVLKS